jgi:hypothetical protein
VELASSVSAQAGKPLFIGEFGAPRQAGSRAEQETVFRELLAAIARHRVPLAAFWVFDLESQDKDWNINFHNDRAYQIRLVSEFNRRQTQKP